MPSHGQNESTSRNSARIVFVNRFYSPDMSATAQILTDVAEALSLKGFDVVVFASRMSYDGQDTFDKVDTANGVQIRRIWSSKFGRSTTLGRLLDYLTFHISITISLFFYLSRGDLLIAKTDPPMLSIPLSTVANLRSAKLINWLQDIFPEVALRLGTKEPKGVVSNNLERLRNRSLKRASMNVAIGQKMAEVVEDLQISTERICIIENFVDDQSIIRTDSHSPELRKEWGFRESDFIVGYSGNLGRAHDFQTILNVAEMLKKSEEVKFLFIGGGAQYDQLNSEIDSRGLTNVYFRPYQPRSKLNESLSLPNLHWASLNPKLEGYIVPSKIYGIAAAGRPLLMIGSPNGEVGRIFSEVPFGECVLPGDSSKAADFILKAQSNRDFTSKMGRYARRYIDNYVSRNHAIAKWEDLVLRTAQIS